MPKRSRRSRRRVTLFSRFRRELRTLSLADRCLFFMFLVLLVQSAAVMFSPPPEAGGETSLCAPHRRPSSGICSAGDCPAQLPVNQPL